MNCLGDAGELRGILASENDGVASEGLASFVAGKQPVRWSLPAKVATEQFQQFGWQQGLPVLAPFAAANPDHISAAIDVRYFEVRYLRAPRTGSIHGEQNRSVAKVFRCLQKRLDLFAAHDDWQFSLVSGEGHALDADLAVQRVGIQEAQPAHNLDVSWQRDSLLFDQEQLILPDLLGAESVRRFVKVLGEVGNSTDVGLNSRGGIVADLKILHHPLS